MRCALAVVMGCVACDAEDADLPDDVVWRSARFDYYTRSAEAHACASVIDVLERHFDVVQGFLNFPWPAGQKIDYRKFLDADDHDGRAHCGTELAAACAVGRNVRSPTAFDQHELVHTYLFGAGEPPPLFVEGIAVALTCEPPGIGWRPTISWDQALPAADRLQLYGTGGTLVAHMLRQYGPEPFMQLYSTLRPDADATDVDEKIRALYGISADEMWQGALVARRPGCFPLWPCSHDPIAVDGTAITVGTQCGLDLDYRRVVAPSSANLLVSSTTEQRGMRLMTCDDRVPPGAVIAKGTLTTGLGLAQVDAGSYYLDFASRPSQIGATIPSAPWAGTDCSSLDTLVVPADPAATLRIVIPPMTRSWFVKLHMAEPHRFAVGSVDTMMLSVCGDCGGAGVGCEAMPLLERGLTTMWSGDIVLHFQPAVLDPEDPKWPLPTAAELLGY